MKDCVINSITCQIYRMKCAGSILLLSLCLGLCSSVPQAWALNRAHRNDHQGGQHSPPAFRRPGIATHSSAELSKTIFKTNEDMTDGEANSGSLYLYVKYQCGRDIGDGSLVGEQLPYKLDALCSASCTIAALDFWGSAEAESFIDIGQNGNLPTEHYKSAATGKGALADPDVHFSKEGPAVGFSVHFAEADIKSSDENQITVRIKRPDPQPDRPHKAGDPVKYDLTIETTGGVRTVQSGTGKATAYASWSSSYSFSNISDFASIAPDFDPAAMFTFRDH